MSTNETQGSTTKWQAAVKHARDITGHTGGWDFPFFTYHRDAVCPVCDGPVTDRSPTRNPPMQGHYSARCPQCRVELRYDCAENSIGIIDLETIERDNWTVTERDGVTTITHLGWVVVEFRIGGDARVFCSKPREWVPTFVTEKLKPLFVEALRERNAAA